ncbi:DUF1800 domain-containing protein [Brevirhabdus sp.]|uniref:DUF1800 domain-containing protein n=1 Tax=Brevirhabdus sp. TaxID=2004514 RepID=UPI00405910B8
MATAADYAAIRFGTGLSPRHDAPRDAGEILARLAAPDAMAARFPVTSMRDRQALGQRFIAARKAAKSGMSADLAQRKTASREMRAVRLADAMALFSRAIYASDAFRERLVLFWADHFTTVAQGRALRGVVSNYVDGALRPHVAGRFSDLLKAAIFHPVMILYLDQQRSFGPNSPVGLKKHRGLNENLARELLELHTLGADGPYTQQDVRELAKLLTGLSADNFRDVRFRPNVAEPGAETVLGRSYGGGRPARADIERMLEDLAVHPATARHLARKLAVHFVADTPEAGLVEAIAQAYMKSDGDLSAAYGAMLDHPAAWRDFGAKAKRPIDFLISSMRALDLAEDELSGLKYQTARQYVFAPMNAMGQKFQSPPAPNGWPEAREAWITPQGLAARIQWAMAVPRALRPDLPDPREFLQVALGGTAGATLSWAARAAQTRWEGVGVILSSPEFNRR